MKHWILPGFELVTEREQKGLVMQESKSLVWAGSEDRRKSGDRRYRRMHHPAYTWRGQRMQSRRAGDQVNVYVDRYGWRWMLITFSIAVLCCADAMMTLNLIGSGRATEVNPVMRALLERDVVWFIAVKFALTGLGLIFLVSHKNFVVFGRVRVSHLLYLALLFYAVLIKYELVLLHL